VRKRDKKNGFTLTELMVTISIIVVISSILIINFRQGEQTYKLQRNAYLVAQGIRKAQNMALSSSEHNGEIKNYYGVYFNTAGSDFFYIFASDNKIYNPGSNEEVEKIELEEGMVIKDISKNNLNIVFSPPYAVVSFNPSVSQATITVGKESGTCPQDCLYIKVNDKGWVAIETTP